MDWVKNLRRKKLARNQKAIEFQSLRGIFLSINAYAVLHCVSFSLYIGYTMLFSLEQILKF
ncbi:hypothetical protein Cylst_5263 [Cylindrospermum stagnale PCC 7417]|uniref:Uncharacterized protein n=1 Tax=Cylindrospermum stagnale PCC 7417 TaxID=56107 RepID=K9X3Q9_9NOST|nr:hypothetical protein Cylst_5263 [Cylindrospermum stagnale PCC 7417]